MPDKEYVCAYKHCLHHGQKVKSSESVIVGNKHYHWDCAATKQEIEEFKSATINKDVYTDSEGVTYNSVTFKDESKTLTEAPTKDSAEYKKLCTEIEFQADENDFNLTEEDVSYILSVLGED